MPSRQCSRYHLLLYLSTAFGHLIPNFLGLLFFIIYSWRLQHITRYHNTK